MWNINDYVIFILCLMSFVAYLKLYIYIIYMRVYNRVANNPLHAPSLAKEILFYVASLISLLEFNFFIYTRDLFYTHFVV